MYVLLTLLPLLLMIGALIDIITRGDWQVRFMPKFVWILLVVLIPLVGSILWFAIGREYDGDGGRVRMPRRREAASGAGPVAPVAPVRTTEQQLADLDREIEEDRLRRAIEQRKRELGEA